MLGSPALASLIVSTVLVLVGLESRRFASTEVLLAGQFHRLIKHVHTLGNYVEERLLATWPGEQLRNQFLKQRGHFVDWHAADSVITGKVIVGCRGIGFRGVHDVGNVRGRFSVIVKVWLQQTRYRRRHGKDVESEVGAGRQEDSAGVSQPLCFCMLNRWCSVLQCVVRFRFTRVMLVPSRLVVTGATNPSVAMKIFTRGGCKWGKDRMVN